MPPRRAVRHGRRRRGAVRSAAAGPGRARAAVGWRGAREGGRSGPHRTGSGCGGFDGREGEGVGHRVVGGARGAAVGTVERDDRAGVAGLVGEPVYGDAVPERGFSHCGAVAPVHGDAGAALPDDFDGPADGGVRGAVGALRLVDEQGREAVGVRGAAGDPGAQAGAPEVGGFLVGDEAAVLKRDDTVRDACRFLDIAGSGEDGSALRGVAAQQAVQPGRLAR